MSRTIDPDLESAIEQPVVRPFLALHIDLPDPVRVFTGQGIFAYDSNGDGIPEDWVGAGGIGSIDLVGEASDGQAVGVRAQLLQVPAQFRSDIAAQAKRGALFEVFIGTFDETFQSLESFQLIWKGRLDQYNVTDAGNTISVEVVGESRQRDQNRPSIKRFTDEYQQRKHPGDLFFQYVPQMVEVPILWAKQESKEPASGGGTAGGGGAGYAIRMVDNK